LQEKVNSEAGESLGRSKPPDSGFSYSFNEPCGEV
jgi:hypothetical protein